MKSALKRKLVSEVSLLILVALNLSCVLFQTRKMKRESHTLQLHCIISIQGVPGGMDKTSGECSLC